MSARSPFTLEFPRSLAVYDDYVAAQRTVDFLSDREFPVEQLMIVGTDLKRVERITGRLTWGRVAAGGIASGLWFGLFVGLVLSIFTTADTLDVIVSTALFGACFMLVAALIGYAMTRGRRDFSSVTQVIATRYEVLVEHRSAERARELLRELPGALPNPFE